MTKEKDEKGNSNGGKLQTFVKLVQIAILPVMLLFLNEVRSTNNKTVTLELALNEKASRPDQQKLNTRLTVLETKYQENITAIKDTLDSINKKLDKLK